ALVGLPVELHPAVAGPLVAPPRDHRPDPVTPQPAAYPRVAVALVARQLHRPAARPPAPAGDADLAQDPLQLRGLVPLSRRHLGRQRPPAAVADQVELRAEAAAAAAQGVGGRLAGR